MPVDAQIASFADHHYAVAKRERKGRVTTDVMELLREERAREIGRMLSGKEITPEALKHAEQLMEAVRGVNIDGVLQTLMERGLVKIAGRAEIPGRPLLYETTQFFLDHFGLRNLDELPNAEELRKRNLPVAQTVTPAAAQTATPQS